jgi:hypothetical protein
MRTAIIAVLVFAFIACCTGCQAFTLRKDYSKLPEVKTPKGPLATYIDDRALDFMDWWPTPFNMRLRMGPGLLFNFRGTKFAQAGWGFFDGETLGFKGRQLGSWREWRDEVGVSVFYITKTKKDLLTGNRFLFDAMRKAEPEAVGDIDIFREDDRDRWDCGCTVHLLFVGLDWDIIRPREIADFLLGLFTLDFQKDDTKNRLRTAEATTPGFVGPGGRAMETVPPTPVMPRVGEGRY